MEEDEEALNEDGKLLGGRCGGGDETRENESCPDSDAGGGGECSERDIRCVGVETDR